jgi:hypothetical protein
MGPRFVRPYLAIGAAGSLLLQGCGAGWHQSPSVEAKPLAPRQQAQIWHHGTPERWHAIHVAADSVSGISYLQPIECDSCRVALPRSEVDSIRIGDPAAGLWYTVGLVIFIPIIAVSVGCAIAHCEDLSD